MALPPFLAGQTTTNAISAQLYPVLYLKKDGTWFEDGSEVAAGICNGIMLEKQGAWFISTGRRHPYSSAIVFIELSEQERAAIEAQGQWCIASNDAPVIEPRRMSA